MADFASLGLGLEYTETDYEVVSEARQAAIAARILQWLIPSGGDR